MVVIHYTAMQSANAACATLCNPANEVSAHYLIDGDGTVRSLVAEDMRAWHAGAGQWGAVTDVNSHSIGIELDNDGVSPFAAAQMDALENLLGDILRRWTIAPARVIGHSDMAPRRKIDPGVRFDWARLVRAGLAVGPLPPPASLASAASDLAQFHTHAIRFGYASDLTADEIFAAFAQRFRPPHGRPSAASDAMMADLAARFPVDATPPTA